MAKKKKSMTNEGNETEKNRVKVEKEIVKQIEKGEKENESPILTADDEECGVYEVSTNTYYFKGIGKNITSNPLEQHYTLQTNKMGYDILIKLFYAIKSEMGYLVDVMHEPKDVFVRTRTILFQDFIGNERKVSTGSELEGHIEKKIENLKKYDHFHIGYGPPTSDNYINSVFASLDIIKNLFISLREKKIEFYEAILEEYKYRKLEYNKNLFLKG